MIQQELHGRTNWQVNPQEKTHIVNKSYFYQSFPSETERFEKPF